MALIVPEKVLVDIWKGDKAYVIRAVDYNIVTQGNTIKEALMNFKEAFILYIEDEDVQKVLAQAHSRELTIPALTIASTVVTYDSKTSGCIGPRTNQSSC